MLLKYQVLAQHGCYRHRMHVSTCYAYLMSTVTSHKNLQVLRVYAVPFPEGVGGGLQ